MKPNLMKKTRISKKADLYSKCSKHVIDIPISFVLCYCTRKVKHWTNNYYQTREQRGHSRHRMLKLENKAMLIADKQCQQ